jgi:hypothetical protein
VKLVDSRSVRQGGNHMANQKHGDVLRQGVEIWNQWREEHPDIQPDLNNANLRKIALGGTNLFGVGIRKAHVDYILDGTVLSRVDLLGISNLSGADLSDANLRSLTLFP